MIAQKNATSELKLSEKFSLLINQKTYLLGESLFQNKLIFDEFSEKKKRESFLNFDLIKLGYISKTHDIIEPYSSSDEEIEDGIKFKTYPSVKDVCEAIVDVNTLMIIDELKDFPSGVRYGLLFENIDSWWDKTRLFKFLSKIPLQGLTAKKLNSYIGEIIIYKQSFKSFAFVKFYSKLICELIFNFLNNKTKQKFYPLRNSDQEPIKVMYCYDLTDMKNSLWYAIVLRNFPTNIQAMQITQFCKSLYPGVLYALPTKEIYNQNCAVIVLNDCEEAESLCSQLNNKEYCTGYFLKSHIHPKSSKFRKDVDRSHFKFILDRPKMKQLGKINFLQKKTKEPHYFRDNNEADLSNNAKNNKLRRENISLNTSFSHIKQENQINNSFHYANNNSKSLIKTDKSFTSEPSHIITKHASQKDLKQILNFNNTVNNNNKCSNNINFSSNSLNNSMLHIKKQKNEFLPYGVACLDDHLEIFKNFQEQTLKIFVNNEADFSPIKPSSPNQAYDKVLNSPRRQINSLLNSPNYLAFSPHRINSPIQGLSEYDDAFFDFENKINFSPIKNI